VRRDLSWAQTASNEAARKLVLEKTEVYRRRDGIRSQTVDVPAEDLRITAQTKRDVCYCGQGRSCAFVEVRTAGSVGCDSVKGSINLLTFHRSFLPPSSV